MVVTGWLSPDGLLKDLPWLNDLGHAVFENIAPVVPEATLSAIERALLKATAPEVILACERYLRPLRLLAWDSTLFERCVRLIVKIVEAGEPKTERDEGKRVLASLFPIRFSGTHASIQQRLTVTNSLLASGEPRRRNVGVAALEAMLEATHFVPGGDFEFGARPRDFGYEPKSGEDVKRWFGPTLEVTKALACSDLPVAQDVRGVLANQFRGLWSGAQMYDELENAFRAISDKGFGREGWPAVRQTIRFDSKDLPEHAAARLSALEVALRPQKLVDQVRAIVLSEGVTFAGLDSEDDKNPDDVASTMRRVADRAEELGRAVTVDGAAMVTLLPELLTGKGQLWNFGRGMAQSATDPAAQWNSVVRQLDAIPQTMRRPEILGGFLNFLNQTNSALANSLLDDAIENESLAPSYPWFQAQVGIDGKGVQRLMRSLVTGKTPAGSYVNLVVGHATKEVLGEELKAFLLALSEKDGGLDAAIQILYMRILSEGPDKSRNPEIVDAGRILMNKLQFDDASGQEDYRLQILTRYCLEGTDATAAVREICTRLGESVARYRTHAFHHEGFLGALFTKQPLAALQGFCAGVEAAGVSTASGLADLARLRMNPIDRISSVPTLCEQNQLVIENGLNLIADRFCK
jgi:hypothetical protein